MQSSNAPTKIALPFANTSSARRAIPAASQIGITPGAASLTDGFPPLTRTALSIGGVPPSGLDMNGALYLLSATDQWGQAGGQPTYDGAFSTAIGGYPLGAVLKSTDGLTWWRCTAENNTSNPDAGGAGWDSDTVLLSAAGDGTPVMDGIAARGASTHGARADHIHPTDTSLLPKAGGTMIGALALDAGSVSTAPTAAPGTNTTQIATTAFAAAATAAAAAAAAATYAPINSPALTGVPAAPTATAGTNTAQLATTAFVQAATAIAASSFSLGSLSTGAVAPNGSGYMAFSNGLILQWCSQYSGDTIQGSPGSTGIINFPLTFPNRCLSCHPTLFANTSEANVSVSLAGGPTTTQAYYQVQEWGSSVQFITVCIFAIGY